MLLAISVMQTASAATFASSSVNVGADVNVTEAVTTTAEIQTIAAGNRTGGTFTLTYSGQTTAAISCTATAAAVETAVEALSNVTAVTVGGGALGTTAVTVQFDDYTGDTAGDPPQMTIGTDSCTGGTTSPSVSTTTAFAGGFVSLTLSNTNAEFKSNNSQSITVIDNSAADTNNATGTITVVVTGKAAGDVVVSGTDPGGAISPAALSVTSAATPGLVTLTSPASVAVGASDDATANVDTAAGANITGATVTFTATGPGSVYRTNSSSSACATSATGVLASSCTINSDGSGDAVVWFQSTGSSGVINLTAAAGSVSDSDNISVVGTASTLTITKAAGNVGSGGEGTVAATVQDSSGTGIPGQSVTFTAPAGASVKAVTTASDCPGTQSVSINTNASGVATAEFCVPTTTAAGTSIVVTATTAGSGTTTLTATDTVTIAADVASVEITTADVRPNGTTEVTFHVLDAAGNIARADTQVTGVATAGVVVGCSSITVGSDGEATCTYVAPSTAQTVTISGVATRGTTTVSGTTTIQVDPNATGTPGTGTGDGSLSAPNFGTGNVGSAVFDGGTIEELSAAVTAAGGTAVWVQGTDGNWYRYNTLATGATAFVNNAFNTQFAAGLDQSAVFVVK